MTASGPDARGKRRTKPQQWQQIRKRIYARDAGRCRCCERLVPKNDWICGHIIDRIVGGTDEDANLAVMCRSCDMAKPIHRTKLQFNKWCCQRKRLADVVR